MNMLGTYLKDLRIMAAILATALVKVDYWYSVLDNLVLKYATTLKKKYLLTRILLLAGR